MIIAVSGSVGVGKTTISKKLANHFSCEYLELNSYAQDYKIEDIEDLQTFDFDMEKLLRDLEKKLVDYKKKGTSIIVESHFAHFISPEIVDVLVIINRDLTELKKEYKKRNYNEQKIKDNLEVESFDLCFFEAEEEGYKPNQFIKIENDEDFEELESLIIKKISKKFQK